MTAIPAFAAGLSHRVGILREGADADLVLWDSHPLQLGATPRKVWFDGILQGDAERAQVPVNKLKKDPTMQEPPKVPNFDVEREKAVRFEGLAPLRPNSTSAGRVVFQNVGELFTRERGDYAQFGLAGYEGMMNVVVERGRVTCIGRGCGSEGENPDMVVDLHGGSLIPGMMHFGPGLGVEEMEGEPSTGDGVRFDPLRANVPEVMGDVGALVKVSDALQFGTRNALCVISLSATMGSGLTMVEQTRAPRRRNVRDDILPPSRRVCSWKLHGRPLCLIPHRCLQLFRPCRSDQDCHCSARRRRQVIASCSDIRCKCEHRDCDPASSPAEW